MFEGTARAELQARVRGADDLVQPPRAPAVGRRDLFSSCQAAHALQVMTVAAADLELVGKCRDEDVCDSRGVGRTGHALRS